MSYVSAWMEMIYYAYWICNQYVCSLGKTSLALYCVVLCYVIFVYYNLYYVTLLYLTYLRNIYHYVGTLKYSYVIYDKEEFIYITT